MNSNHDNSKDDRSLDAELDQLNQQYRGAESLEPPEMLDQAILNKARLAAEPKNSWLDFGWIHGLTTVALVVLTVSIFTLQKETGEFEPTVGKPAERLRNDTDGQLSGRAANADKSTAEEASSYVDRRTRDSKADARTSSAVADDEGEVSKDEQVQISAKRASQAPSSDISVDALKEEIPDVSGAREQDGALRQNRAPATSPAPAREEKQSLKKEQLHDFSDSQESVQELERSATPDPTLSQQQWVDEILKLKQAGDSGWTELLAEFKKRYPEFPLPEELQHQD